MSDNWDSRADWWSNEVATDTAYETDVIPLLLTLLPDAPGVVMDLGCGEGQGLRHTDVRHLGCDLSQRLLTRCPTPTRVVRARLPDLSWLASDSLDAAYTVHVLDLIQDDAEFFEQTARVVKSSGSLTVVINHPVYTAPGSAPIADQDGEMLWRWGTYLAPGSSLEPAGDGSVEFFHRPLADLLTAAARSGWCLEDMIERGLSDATVERFPGYAGQQHVPRLLGVRWKRIS